MKKMKINTKFFAVLGLISLMFTSCDEGDAVVDDVTANTKRGAILRTVELISNELPIGVADGSFMVELEVQSEENGTLVNSVEVHVGFRDNTDDVGPGTNVDQQLFATVDKSTFTTGEFGLPRFTYSATLPEMLAFVGRTEAEITGGDQFEVRFELVLDDGRRFSFAQNSGTLTGSYFSSPFLYTPTVICPIPDGAFTGMYSLVQENDGPLGTTFENGTYEIVATGGTSRAIDVNAYPQFGGFARTFLFELICDSFKVGDVDTGLACVAGEPTVLYGPADTTTTYDVNDDSVIVITFKETGGSCGPEVDVTITLTKV